MSMNIPITQNGEWQKLQEDLGETSFLITEKDYQFLAILKQTKLGNYLYCPYGPVLENKAALKGAMKRLRDLAREHGAIFIRIEPTLLLTTKELEKSARELHLKLQKSTDLNPKETWLLDLTGTDDELKSRLPSRLLRYYRSAEKNGITIETSHNPDDIHYLLDLQKALAKKKGINTFSEDYLRTELKQPFSTLYLVRQQVVPSEGDPQNFSRKQNFGGGDGDRTRCQNVIAAGLVFDDKTTRYNLQGAQSDQGRALHATGILTIQLILDAKAKNKRIFDFWGIAPEGAPATHPWAGFTQFKKTFAGYEEQHTGTYDLILNPAKYRIYNLARKINRKARR